MKESSCVPFSAAKAQQNALIWQGDKPNTLLQSDGSSHPCTSEWIQLCVSSLGTYHNSDSEGVINGAKYSIRGALVSVSNAVHLWLIRLIEVNRSIASLLQSVSLYYMKLKILLKVKKHFKCFFLFFLNTLQESCCEPGDWWWNFCNWLTGCFSFYQTKPTTSPFSQMVGSPRL